MELIYDKGVSKIVYLSRITIWDETELNLCIIKMNSKWNNYLNIKNSVNVKRIFNKFQCSWAEERPSY